MAAEATPQKAEIVTRVLARYTVHGAVGQAVTSANKHGYP
jgi:hypothetical protein